MQLQLRKKEDFNVEKTVWSTKQGYKSVIETDVKKNKAQTEVDLKIWI